MRWSTATAEELVREAARLGAPQVLLVRASCACARVVLPCTRPEDRAVCEHAINTAERWTRGEATAGECERAAKAAWKATRASAEAAALAAALAAEAAALARAAARVAAWSARAAAGAWAWASRALGDHTPVHDAARAVLTREVMAALALRHAVLGDAPDERDAALFDDAVAAGELRSTVTAWCEVDGSGREGEAALLARLVEGAREAVVGTVVYEEVV